MRLHQRPVNLEDNRQPYRDYVRAANDAEKAELPNAEPVSWRRSKLRACFEKLAHPGGMDENSPVSPLRDWDRSPNTSKLGTAEPVVSQLPLRDLSRTIPAPSVETLGYFRSSLRDGCAGPLPQILVTLGGEACAVRFARRF